ncbi:crossover junction endodeoxyribonuclease RuvC [Candidatus Saccharibacteria bacterium]|nr:crossover junction endodeoxyribonuclease RuvC [Candidatus Saccharibacteria bacterium]
MLGIDPGTGRLGFGVIEINGSKISMLDAGVITTPANTEQPDRLETIYDELKTIINELKPEIMVVEKLFFAQNVTTAMAVAQARGVVMLVGKQSKLEIHEYTPLQIKMGLTGYGRASKQQIQEMVRVLLGLQQIPKPDDAADALAVALVHAHSLKTMM